VLSGLELPPEAVAMVGDDIETDVGGALNASLTAILVRTGKYRKDAVRIRRRTDSNRRLDRRCAGPPTWPA